MSLSRIFAVKNQRRSTFEYPFATVSRMVEFPKNHPQYPRYAAAIGVWKTILERTGNGAMSLEDSRAFGEEILKTNGQYDQLGFFFGSFRVEKVDDVYYRTFYLDKQATAHANKYPGARVIIVSGEELNRLRLTKGAETIRGFDDAVLVPADTTINPKETDDSGNLCIWSFDMPE